MDIKSISSTAVSVTTFVFAMDDEGSMCILAGRRGDTAPTGAGLLNPPMGLIDDGETDLEAAVREVEEETRITLSPSLFEDMGLGSRGLGRYYRVILDKPTNSYVIGAGDGENEQFEWLALKNIDPSDWAFGLGVRATDWSPSNK